MTELKAISDLKSGRSTRRSNQGNMQLGQNSTTAEFDKINEEEIV